MKYVKLSDIADIQIGKTPKRSERRYWGDGFPWLSISDMKTEIISKTKEQITEEAVVETGCKLIKKGTLLMSFKLSVGKLAFAGTDLYTNEAICGFILKKPKNVNTKYLYYALKNTKMTGSNIAAKGITLNSNSLRNLQIPFYENIDDQDRIAELLTKADNLIKQRNESISLLDLLLKNTFLEMFIHNEQKNDWLFTEVKKLVEKTKNAIKAGPFGSSLKKEFYVENGYKIYGQEQVISDDINFGDYYINNDLYKKLESCKIKEGDVLISLVGTYGKILVIPKDFKPGIINPRLMKISFDKEVINPIYFKYLFKSEYLLKQLKNLSRGGTMDIINASIVKELKIPVPPITLQNQFMVKVDKVDKLKKNYESSLKELENMYGALSQKVFKGELNVEDINLKKKEIETMEYDDIEKYSTANNIVKEKQDISKMNLLDYFGVPEDIQRSRENIEFEFINDDIFYQFLLKSGFKNKSFTLLEIETKYFDYFYHGANLDFDNQKWKEIIFKFMEANPPLIEQFFDDEAKIIKLKLTDEAYKA